MSVPCRTAAAFAATAVLLAAVLGPAGSETRGDRGREAPAAAPGPGANLSVAVDPASWWMESGANATFAATWVGTPAGCSLDPIWFRWAVAPDGSDGTLEVTNGSETTFRATDEGSGTTTIVVHGAASLRCHSNVTAAFGGASTVVTVSAPVALRELAVAPDPVAPNGSTDLAGSVVGGDPPYLLRVAWGDGNVSYANVSGPGPFSVPHTYGVAGTFAPVLLATDRAGRLAEASPEEPVYVSAGFAAAIVPSSPIAEVGVPVTFGVATIAPPRNFSSLFLCEDAVPAGSDGPGLVYGCAFEAVGVAPVTFEAVASSSPFAITTATLDEGVVPPPSLAFPTEPPPGEVGLTVYAPVDLTGGVPPFTLSWSLVGTGAGGVQTASSDGLDYLPLNGTEAGTLVLSVLVVDSLGVASTAAAEQVAFCPSLQMAATAAATVVNGTVALNVSGSAFEGAPPFDWTVVPRTPAANGSVEAGTLPAPGAFAWNATYLAEGALAIVVAVVDAEGASAVRNLSVALAPALAVSAEVDPTGPGLVTLTMTVSGGLGPFAYAWNDSAGDAWNGTTAHAGTTVLREATRGSGPCSFDVRVVDALGAIASSQRLVTLPPADALATVSSNATSIAAIVAILVAAAAAVVVLRRRRSPALPSPPDPVAVLREAIEPSDGVDRGLVELLAEERGVPLEVVRATLDRLKADGTVRSGRGNDGEEVLAWSPSADR